MDYEPLRKERFVVEHGEYGERVRIKPRKQIFAMLFLPFWLAGWTFGGIEAISQVLTTGEPFLIFWLCGWAVGWVFAASVLAWMFTGSETLQVQGRDFEISHGALGFKRRWLYDGSVIRNFSVASQSAWASQFQVPFFRVPQNGSIKFDYGPRTIYFAAGLDEAEARLIVDRLAKRLPQ